MSEFTIQNLTGERTLVRGTDSAGTTHQTVLSTTQWSMVKAHQNYRDASESFDAEVEAFFKPLTSAVDKLEQAKRGPAPDPATFIVLHEGTEGTTGSEPVVEHLNPDSVVLRLIERGDFDRLVWVGDSLEVLETLPGSSTPTALDALSEVVDSDS